MTTTFNAGDKLRLKNSNIVWKAMNHPYHSNRLIVFNATDIGVYCINETGEVMGHPLLKFIPYISAQKMYDQLSLNYKHILSDMIKSDLHISAIKLFRELTKCSFGESCYLINALKHKESLNV